MREALGRLKETASRLTRAGDQQVQSISERQSEITRRVAERVHTSLALIIGISAAVIVLALFIGLRTVRLIRNRMTEAVALAEAVSRGELKHVTLHRDNDETGRLLAALELMVNTLTDMVRRIRHASDAINAGSASISGGNSELQAQAEQQAGSLQQTAASMEQLTSTVRQSVTSAQQANKLAHSAREAASGGGRAVGEIVATMHEIQESSRQIGEIISVIDGISFQTNILALNAAVEAARAGAQGRGFAVVASEVRNLAQRSAVAAQEIKSLITSSVQRVDAGSELVERAGARIGEMVSQVVQVTDLIAEISRASDEQFHSLSQVNQTVKSLDDLTQRNAALAQRGTASASVLCEQAKGLNDAVSRFKIDVSVQMSAEDDSNRRNQVRKRRTAAALT
jgi:methyl-accepting chemotaxis protein